MNARSVPQNRRQNCGTAEPYAYISADALRNRIFFRFVQLDEELALAAAEIAADYALRGADAVYVAVARAHACTLVSPDREQCERATPVVRTLTPVEALAELT